MGSGGERPTHEEANEAVELERIQVLTRQVADAKRLAKIRELERQLEELKANATEVKGDPPRREEVDSSPDESGFPRYSNPVDTGLRSSGLQGCAAAVFRHLLSRRR